MSIKKKNIVDKKKPFKTHQPSEKNKKTNGKQKQFYKEKEIERNSSKW